MEWLSNLFRSNTAPVQTAMLVQMIQMMQEYQREVLIPEMPKAPEHTDQLRRLQKLGFTNTKITQEHNQQMEQYKNQLSAIQSAENYKQYIKETMEVLFDARRYFGPDTLLIRFDDFEKLMNKFNLVCGTFKMYEGEVPVKKIGDIETLTKKMEYAPWYITNLEPITKVEVIYSLNYDGIPRYICRFPFIYKGNYSWESFDFHGKKTRDWKKGYELKSGDNTKLFICAPSKDMQKLTNIIPFSMTADPFICAHTKYGILVFTRWGEEANSTIIKKYEQLNKMIEQRRLR